MTELLCKVVTILVLMAALWMVAAFALSLFLDERAQSLWCAARVHEWREPNEGGSDWSFQGVFGSEEKAVAACRDELYFVAPVNLDQELPHDRLTWPGAYYPHLESKPPE